METFEDEVLSVLRSLGAGQVTSYGEVAAQAGSPGAARAVGNILRRGPAGIPWWRVVRSDGSLACANRAEQAARLTAEGVRVRDGRVVVTRK
ncbi:MAG TPA: MGMT family protein [Acidimicrobiales bacterium]